MKAVLDACVLFPTVMREILVGCAEAGLYEPVWSARIVEEWLRAADRLGPDARGIAAAEAVQMRAAFPQADVRPPVRDDINLPDASDVHVLSAALVSGADLIVTANLRDFPTRILAAHGLRAAHPDPFLLGLADASGAVRRVVADVVAKAERISGRPQPVRALLKRAGLPRLGKAFGQS